MAGDLPVSFSGLQRAFFIVGPTAAGKSALAAEVAAACGGEVVNADAFQLYSGLDLLTAKPDAEMLASVRHHLVGTVVPTEEMNAEKFRALAEAAIGDINRRGKIPIVVGGTGLYIKALTHGLARLPAADAALRARLDGYSHAELHQQLVQLDPQTAATIDVQNRRRLVRALEVCLLTGRPFSAQRNEWRGNLSTNSARGIFLFRERAELHARIAARVREMFARGVINEVRTAGPIGASAAQTLGLREVRALIANEITLDESITRIEQATRRYAKRQLTWFRRQSNFEPLNLSDLHGHAAAVGFVSERLLSAGARRND